MWINSIYGLYCPGCSKVVWYSNGNKNGLTVEDISALKCPYCKHKWLLSDENIKDLDDDDFVLASKTPNKAANISKYSKEQIKFLSDILERMRKEVNKRSEIYKHGVDLANYENKFTSCAVDLLDNLFDGKAKEEIEWWLWDNVDKVYYKEIDSDEILANVEKAEDFVRFLIDF